MSDGKMTAWEKLREIEELRRNEYVKLASRMQVAEKMIDGQLYRLRVLKLQGLELAESGITLRQVEDFLNGARYGDSEV